MAEKKPANLAEALIAFQAAVPTIHDNDNSFHGAFANMEGILSVIGPALRNSGLVVSQLPEELDGQPGLRTTLMHTSGEQVTAVSPLIVAAGKNVTQEWGKAITYQRRYALQSVLGICAGIKDNDADADPTVRSTTTATQGKEDATQAPSEDEDLGQEIAPGIAQDWVTFIKAQKVEWRNPLLKGFAIRFNTGNKLISNCITHDKHTAWLNTYVNAHPAENQEGAAQ